MSWAGNAYTPTSDTVDAFVHDGIHPNNVVGGIFANVFIEAFNQEYAQMITPFSEQEILLGAGPNTGALYDFGYF